MVTMTDTIACPAYHGQLEFRTSPRSPTRYARCANCGTFISFSKRATAKLDDRAKTAPRITRRPTAVNIKTSSPSQKSLYELIRDGEF